MYEWLSWGNSMALKPDRLPKFGRAPPRPAARPRKVGGGGGWCR